MPRNNGNWSQPSRPDPKINEVMDQLFHGRFCEKGTCQDCKKHEALGIFGPDGHDKFYCRACWKKYLKEQASEDEWQSWVQWKPPERVCPSENSYQCEVKFMLLALSRLGGSITFPSSLSSYDRRKVHEFCNKEPELNNLFSKSYGEGDERFLRVSSFDFNSGLKEAKAIVQAEEAQAVAAQPSTMTLPSTQPSTMTLPPPPPPPAQEEKTATKDELMDQKTKENQVPRPGTKEKTATKDEKKEQRAQQKQMPSEDQIATKDEQKEQRTQKDQVPRSSTEEKTASKEKKKEEKTDPKDDQNGQSKQEKQKEKTDPKDNQNCQSKQEKEEKQPGIHKNWTQPDSQEEAKDEFPSLASGLGQGAGRKKKGGRR